MVEQILHDLQVVEHLHMIQIFDRHVVNWLRLLTLPATACLQTLYVHSAITISVLNLIGLLIGKSILLINELVHGVQTSAVDAVHLHAWWCQCVCQILDVHPHVVAHMIVDVLEKISVIAHCVLLLLRLHNHFMRVKDIITGKEVSQTGKCALIITNGQCGHDNDSKVVTRGECFH